ncbi:MAG: MFS transporter [Alphaproteobacteria bacterium]|nr:MFS transporter [Alphaproteobacteria bacterium]
MTKKLSAYLNKQMMIILLFGFSSGLPLMLVFGTLSLWLKDYNIAYSAIGAFSLVRLPYSFKWMWAPLVETVPVPLLKRIGKRRSWALVAQIGLFISLAGLSSLTPSEDKSMMLAMAAVTLCVSFFSATQDIVLDAFRVELCEGNTEQEVKGATIYVLGYRIGLVVSGAGAIGLAAFYSWNVVYFINALLIILGMIAVLMAHEPEAVSTIKPKQEKSLWKYAFIEPFKEFIKHPYWLAALWVVFSYRLSDAYFGPMAYPYYDDLGFTKGEIAYITKIYGMAATIVGGILGGVLLARIGLIKGLIWLSFVQGITTALYIPLYYVGHNIWFLMFTISLENLSSGMATTAIIAFMSVLCNKGHTATQYALLSSLTGVARDLLAATSGYVLEQTSWPIFFTISALLTLPGAAFCFYLYKKRPAYLIKS